MLPRYLDLTCKSAVVAMLLLLLPPATVWKKRILHRSKPIPAHSAFALTLRQRHLIATVRASASWLNRRAVWTPNCLSLAVSAAWLLRLVGIASTVHVGVRFDEHGVFRSHAWLIVAELAPVTGGPAGQGFHPVWTGAFDARTP